MDDPAAEIVPSRRLLRDHVTMVQWFQWLLHAALNWLTIAVCAGQTLAGFTADYRLLAIVLILTFSAVGRFIGFHRRYVVGRLAIWRISELWILTSALVLMMLLTAGILRRFDPNVLTQMFLVGYLAHFAGFWVFRLVAGFWQRSLGINVPSLVVGSGLLAERLINSINRNDYVPMRVVGALRLDEPEPGSGSNQFAAPILGRVGDLDRVIEETGVDRVYIALDAQNAHQLLSIQQSLLKHQLDVIWVPDIFSVDLLNPSVRELGGLPVISLSESPLISGPKAFIKSVVDAALALILTVVLSPVLLTIALLVKLSSPGPVFYRQQRHGWDGSRFRIWKFRTMVVHDESHGIKQATCEDPRITPIGHFLRRTSLDELPQLFNVLEGNMSLVGPRPHAVEHNNEFSKKLDAYMARHRVKPGITGWAQIHGYRGETDTIEKMHKRLQYDLYYINRWSLKLDFLILFLTPFRLLNENAR